ncbi:CopG family transcriptional regulator [Candidatus Bathyarchaeota archaeon]|nr:CopG family transcriptional regulator [Candidatus Bathyarchaeota archaeon]
MAGNFKEVKLPDSLHKRIEKRLPNTEFKTVSEYVTFLVREVLNNIEKEEDDQKAFTDEEEKEIEERLRNLGYID